MARVRTPGKFKVLIKDRFLKDLPREERRERVAQVFFGTDFAKLTPTPEEEEWNKGLDNIEAFLVHFAKQFADANVYNALSTAWQFDPATWRPSSTRARYSRPRAQRSSTSVCGPTQTASGDGTGAQTGFGPTIR